jgi:hypothetical protein
MFEKYVDPEESICYGDKFFPSEMKKGYRDLGFVLALGAAHLRGERILDVGLQRIEKAKSKDFDDYFKGNSLNLANELMRRGLVEKNLEYSFVGLNLYDSFGLSGRKSVRRRFELATKLDSVHPDLIKKGRKILKKNNFILSYDKIIENSKNFANFIKSKY